MVMSPAIKIIFKFTRFFWNPEMVYLCHVGSAPRWWTPGYGREGARDPVITCYVTSERARFFDSLDDRQVLNISLSELSNILGGFLISLLFCEPYSFFFWTELLKVSGKGEMLILFHGHQEPRELLEKELVDFKIISWGKEKFTRGGYACLSVGKLESSRKQLFQPVQGVLFFAGEATAFFSEPQTVHGALESGLRAAHLVHFSGKNKL
eukprot:TRINITY_DN4573_c0_g2_i6.p1 TRINITY_DN4573_c0_g2~~TRINITY_DN4573_c0_g2_i6.p1  ORF type:complete len:209 (-),score=31.31 TRINITY_DN4573_c0_g2_i6:280-906(-)